MKLIDPWRGPLVGFCCDGRDDMESVILKKVLWIIVTSKKHLIKQEGIEGKIFPYGHTAKIIVSERKNIHIFVFDFINRLLKKF